MENNAELKYQYHMHTWGGFYNDEYKSKHKHEPGDYFFNTDTERQAHIKELKRIETMLNAKHLMITQTEGYACNIRTVLHRVVEWKGKRYYSSYDMGINYPISAAKYHMEWKWYPGFNDYPLGEDFDYDTNQVTVIQQWITGAEQEIEMP